MLTAILIAAALINIALALAGIGLHVADALKAIE